MKKKKAAKKFIRMLARAYEENRSDVSDYCYEFLENWDVPMVIKPEKRFIRAKIPGTQITVEYDTLTTELSYIDREKTTQWEQCTDHEYGED